MSIALLARQLLDQDILTGLTPLQLTEIVRRADRIVYAPGEFLIEAGTEGDAAIVLIAGDAVRVPDDAERSDEDGEPSAPTAEPIEAGSLLGELAMLIEHVHGATVVARGPVRAIRITREALREQMLEDPSLAEHFVARIAGRLANVAEELSRIDHRLARASGAPAPAC